MKENKYRKTILLVFILIGFVAAGACWICDMAMNGAIAWSGIPIAAIAFAILLLTSLLMAERHKIVPPLLCFTIFILPFLNVLEWFVPVKGWFLALAVPVAIATVIAMWLMLFLVKLCKLNRWDLSAAAVLLYGIVYGNVLRYYICRFLEEELYDLSFMISNFSCIVVIMIFVLTGRLSRQMQQKEQGNLAD